jgi:hypothetical protein|tara:strand:- start:4424 stop:5566 length:1143 start_codon:yes stop_codon:yes gene_type:complete
MSESNTEKVSLQKFISAIKDFATDINGTFPEYQNKMHQGINEILEGKLESENITELYEYSKKVYPSRFFDFLYQNESMFADDNIDTCFLPNIDFKELWDLDISDKTKNTIWKYLQLICFSLINNADNLNGFGETSKLFEAIGESELKEKLAETISGMSDMFDLSGASNIFNMDNSGNSQDLPDPDDLHEHINGLMKGKLGRLASEITEETMGEFQDLSGVSSVGDVFTKLFKDPGRLMKMVKKLGDSLDSKIKSGEIKESELMEEAAEMMKNMKKMPGMDNMQGLFEKMGLGAMGGGNSKVNMNAMRGQLNQNIKTSKMKERMREKLKKRQAANNKDSQIAELEKQLMEAKNTNTQLETIIGTKQNKKKKRRKRKQKNKK